MLSNNDILKKIRVALSLRTEEVIHILSLVDFTITKGALGDLYRHEDHPNYQEAGDQILRNFLNGLVLYKRGTPENPINNPDEKSTIAVEKSKQVFDNRQQGMGKTRPVIKYPAKKK